MPVLQNENQYSCDTLSALYIGSGRSVVFFRPEILLSGNHEKVRQWRRKQALRRTRARRPDMYAQLDLSSKQDKKLLKEMEAEDRE